MTVPSREEAARLLLSLDPPDWHLRHSRAVAEIAGWLALRVERSALRGSAGPGAHRRGSGAPVDRGVVEAAALLHDVDKALPEPARPATVHGAAGAAWLRGHGFPELEEAVALHPVTLLVDRRGTARVLDASIEARIVAYADKRAGQRLESMADRFARWHRRHPHSRAGDGWDPETAATAWQGAVELERGVCRLAACRPEAVGRLRWSSAAFAEARRRAHDPRVVRP